MEGDGERGKGKKEEIKEWSMGEGGKAVRPPRRVVEGDGARKGGEIDWRARDR